MATLPEMTTHPMKRQSPICKCRPQCKTYLDIEDIGRYCENQAMDMALQLINLSKGLNIANGRYNQGAWTTKESDTLKEWVLKGIRPGDYGLLAKLLGRSISSIKNRVYLMRAEGIIPPFSKQQRTKRSI